MKRTEQPARPAYESHDKSGTVLANPNRRATRGLDESPTSGAPGPKRDWPKRSADDDPTTIHVPGLRDDDAPHAGRRVTTVRVTGPYTPASEADAIRTSPGQGPSRHSEVVHRPARPTPTRTARDDDETTSVHHGALARVQTVCALAEAQPAVLFVPLRPYDNEDDDDVTGVKLGTRGLIEAPRARSAEMRGTLRREVPSVLHSEAAPSARASYTALRRPAASAAPAAALDPRPLEERFPPLRVVVHHLSTPESQRRVPGRAARALAAFAVAACAAAIVSTALVVIASGYQATPRPTSSQSAVAAPDANAPTVSVRSASPWGEPAPDVPFDVASPQPLSTQASLSGRGPMAVWPADDPSVPGAARIAGGGVAKLTVVGGELAVVPPNTSSIVWEPTREPVRPATETLRAAAAARDHAAANMSLPPIPYR